jgi:hypothetical protein
MKTAFSNRFIGMVAAILLAIPIAALAAPPKTKLDTPKLAFGDITPSSIDIIVTAGATGAPAGFSLQWMSVEEYEANGNMWYASDVVCKASFSGNANGSNFILGANQSATVNIGDSLFDQSGASSNCIAPLSPCTSYIFHAFAHATSKLAKSDWSLNLTAATGGCSNNVCRTYPNAPISYESYGNCTVTQGYWKTHGVVPLGNNNNEWAFTLLNVGGVDYTQAEVLAIYGTTGAGGNGLLTLAHQLMTAKINVNQGADATSIADAIAAADALIATVTSAVGNKIPPSGTAFLSASATTALTEALALFNEGTTGPGHCGKMEDGECVPR